LFQPRGFDGKKRGRHDGDEKDINPTDSSEKGKPIVRWGRKAMGSFERNRRMARLPEKKKEER